MFKAEYEQKNSLKPWMVFHGYDWVSLVWMVISIAIFLWGIIDSLLNEMWMNAAILTIFFFVFIRFVTKFIKVRQIIVSKFGTENWTKEILFNEDEIIITETGSKGSYTTHKQYQDVVGFLEDREYITLKMKTLPNVVIRRGTFTVGTWEDCRQFIEEHGSVTKVLSDGS